MGVTAGASVARSTIWRRSSMNCSAWRRPGKSRGACSISKATPSKLGARHRNRAFDIYWRERDEGGLALFQGFDYAVEAGYVWHKTVLLRYSLVKILYQRVPGLTIGIALP